jgi:hypothetical protein
MGPFLKQAENQLFIFFGASFLSSFDTVGVRVFAGVTRPVKANEVRDDKME